MNQTLTQPTVPAKWISDALVSLGVLPNQTGYQYLQDAIVLKALEPDLSMTKALYPAVGKRSGVSSVAVEKAVRTAIQTAYLRGDLNQWRSFFAPDKSGQVPQPTNGHFITRLAECYREAFQVEVS